MMNAEAKANGANSYARRPLTANVIEEWKKKAKKRVSGYWADRSDQESPSMGAYSLDKEIRAKQVEIHAKRRRLEESAFQAHNARNDLKKAGISCPPGLVGRSRALLVGSVDMSKVNLVVVSNDQVVSGKKEEKQSQVEVVKTQQDLASFGEYSKLLSLSQQYYITKGRIPTPSEEEPEERFSDTTGTNSTGTNSDSSDYEPPEILPKLLEIQEEQKASHSIPDYVIQCIGSSLDASRLSLEEALMNMNSARIIVDASRSFTIIHANGAFSKLSGIPCHNMIGSELKEVLDSFFIPSTEKDTKITFVSLKPMRKTEDSTQTMLAMRSFQVQSADKVTHFALDFSPSSSISFDQLNSCNGTLQKHFNAIG
jgi:hypothetical protein